MSLDWSARLRCDVLIDHVGRRWARSYLGSSVRAPAALLLAGLVSLGPVSEAVAQPSLRIGVSISRTGAYARLAPTLERGYQLCVRHTNEKGGVLGRMLELVVDDDRSEPATAARIYERLIARDKVEAILGALRGKFFNVLVTDEETALRLLERDAEPPASGEKKIRRQKPRERR